MAMDLIRSHMASCKRPGTYDRVYNNECVFSFDSPFSPDGLFVSLSNWQGVGEKYVEEHSRKTSSPLYLHIKKIKTEKAVPRQVPEAATMNDLLQASLPENKFDITEELSIVVIGGESRTSIPFPNDDLPMIVSEIAQAVATHTAAGDAEEVATSVADEEVPVSKYADNLPWLENGVKVSPNPSSWVCAESGMKENLWLNLSTGHIGSGRRQWDGSGGTDGALEHFRATGKQYPLAVKLGTITPAGGDVYSYADDEDCMVSDPKLGEHLARWGINIMDLEKTDKTMAELQLEINKSYDFSAITEAGSKLIPVKGPGLTGLVNLGNSCYMNSTLQMLMLSENSTFAARFGGSSGKNLLTSAPLEDPGSDVLTQTAKLACGVLSGDYAGDDNIRPQMFKGVIGRGHPEFCSGRQQDAVEYFEHLLKTISRAEHAGSSRLSGDSLASDFSFTMQSRIECNASKTVRYGMEPGHTVLRLPVPLKDAINIAEVESQAQKRARLGEEKDSESSEDEKVIPVVPMEACFAEWASSENINDFKSPAVGGSISPEGASKSSRFASFPPFLVVQAQRFTIDAQWQQSKLEVKIQVPDVIDIEYLRGSVDGDGNAVLKDGETPMPEEDTASAAPSEPTIDESVVSALADMGFSQNGCKRACIACGNDLPQAMEWIFNHSSDPDFNDPVSGPTSAEVKSNVNPEAVMMLTSMGFSEQHVSVALEQCSGDAERAADWLFSHSDDLDGAVAALESGNTNGTESSNTPVEVRNGAGKYRLRGFVSHIGKNTGSGHYVCHGVKNIDGEEKWVIFNDSNVALSEVPPREHAYMYLFERL